MLLLIHNSFAEALDSVEIYIPLCFYLYDISTPFRVGLLVIYIPLCFYLYHIRSSVRTYDVKFTFHYASTYTPAFRFFIICGIYLHSTMLLLIRIISIRLMNIPFTFHYASTYTILLPGLSSHKFNLHSTMLLLIPWLFIHSLKIVLHLHSTMLLLIRGCNEKDDIIEENLHSTMLLLIPIPVYGHTATNILFTFHYASTYTE